MANLPFSSTSAGDAAKVVRAALTADTLLDGGIVQDSGLETYSSSGINNNDGPAWVKYEPSAGEQTALESVAHIQFEIDSTFLNIANGVFFGLATTGNRLRNNGNSFRSTLDGVDTNLTDGTGAAVIYAPDRPSAKSVIDLHNSPAGYKVFIDNILVYDGGAAIPAAEFAALALLNNTNGGEDFPAANIRNFYCYSALQLFPASNESYWMFGDSFINQGHYSDDYPQYVAPDPKGSINKDFGISARLEGLRADLGHTALIRSKGTSGGRCTGLGAGDLANQVNVLAPSDLQGARCFIQIGTNDVLGGQAIVDDYHTSLQTHVNTLITNNAGDIFLSTVTSTQMQGGADPGDVALVAEVNAAIAAVASTTPNVYVSDLFTATGGESYNTDYFLAGGGNLHLSPEGNKLSAETLNAAINSASTGSPTLTTQTINAQLQAFLAARGWTF